MRLGGEMGTNNFDDYRFKEFPSEWEDTAIVSKVKRNRNGSLTVQIQIDVSGNDGESWQSVRLLRLEKQKPQEATDGT
jgi:hypothetical protein